VGREGCVSVRGGGGAGRSCYATAGDVALVPILLLIVLIGRTAGDVADD
jgi:hypothetical protein